MTERRCEEVEFCSEGATLRGRLFLPASRRPAPAVVMAHGFSATAHGMVADRFAQAFADAGAAALLYDHRGLGRSSGQPRGEINPWIQTRGYRDALDAIATMAQVRADRLGVWGDSLSGGEVLAVAAVDERVQAVIAQVPACGRTAPPPDPGGDLHRRMRQRLLHEEVRADPEEWRGPLPVVSADQVSVPSALTPLTAFRWFAEYGGRSGTGWENRAVLTAPQDGTWQPVLWAEHVSAPTCFLVAHDDEMPGAVPAVAHEAFEALGGPKELHEIEGGHFGLLHWPGKNFDHACALQTGFLRRMLLVDRP